MSPEEKELEIISHALNVFMKYGIKAVTMDDMSRHLGISKKTLYNFVKDKNDLVTKTLKLQCNSENKEVCSILERKLNAIEEMFEIGKYISSMLKEVHPSIHYDLEKYHPDAFEGSIREHKENVFGCISKNLEKGIEEGYYRKDLNIKVIAHLYIRKIDLVFDAKIFPPNEITFDQVYGVMFGYHIRGIASKKGIEYLEKRQKKQKKKRQQKQ
ncbi:MAG: TetR/AcrR family transcriptional regulator [Flavobacteriales bacterium]|nr:TetR/AcrR family transcriptional regulator [Flavobacteriales bacterium]